MKQRLANPSALIDISGIKDLAFIRADAGAVAIGAAHQARRRRDLRRGAQGDSRARPSGRRDRRSGRAPHGYDRRLARQQRSGGGLSGCGLGLGATVKTTKREIARRRFLHRHVRDRARGRRNRERDIFPRCGKGWLREIPESGLALCDGRRVRGKDEGRRARGGDRRRVLRLPRAGDGSGARQELHARGGCRRQGRRRTISIRICTVRPNTARIWSP